ncbi:MAG: tRNA (adenosine(37)-N6)-threonylcarbamoyltransferase complex ATPase subunit type 1 TsaE [bacterium]|nr:tRNA (adenosine(37)-N6)-threonylcarbamoyltransferase complex ATPase subunit type 1 TsaE [bacterium]
MTSHSTTIRLTQAENYAAKMAQTIRGGEIFALSGDLGSGKTTFTKALGKSLGIKRNIPSPTFVIMQQFETNIDSKQKLTLYHLDLYRTKNFKEVVGLGITEWWGHPETITVIEWSDKIKEHLPTQTIYIHFERDINAHQ